MRFKSLTLWIVGMISTSFLITKVTRPHMAHWYTSLHQSPLTPPNYVFPIVWIILYGLLGVCGWMIWHQKSVSNPRLLKILYSLQIGAHWAWSPLFFRYHLVEVSLALILFMDVLMVTIMGLAYEKKRAITFLLIPNIVWISFATYLIFYIWTHN